MHLQLRIGPGFDRFAGARSRGDYHGQKQGKTDVSPCSWRISSLVAERSPVFSLGCSILYNPAALVYGLLAVRKVGIMLCNSSAVPVDRSPRGMIGIGFRM